MAIDWDIPRIPFPSPLANRTSNACSTVVHNPSASMVLPEKKSVEYTTTFLPSLSPTYPQNEFVRARPRKKAAVITPIRGPTWSSSTPYDSSMNGKIGYTKEMDRQFGSSTPTKQTYCRYGNGGISV